MSAFISCERENRTYMVEADVQSTMHANQASRDCTAKPRHHQAVSFVRTEDVVVPLGSDVDDNCMVYCQHSLFPILPFSIVWRRNVCIRAAARHSQIPKRIAITIQGRQSSTKGRKVSGRPLIA